MHLVQYGLYMIESYRLTGQQEYLDRAVANADALLAGAEDHDGALRFPYGFDYDLHVDSTMTLTAPWYSGMAQGQALSLFVRLHAEISYYCAPQYCRDTAWQPRGYHRGRHQTVPVPRPDDR